MAEALETCPAAPTWGEGRTGWKRDVSEKPSGAWDGVDVARRFPCAWVVRRLHRQQEGQVRCVLFTSKHNSNIWVVLVKLWLQKCWPAIRASTRYHENGIQCHDLQVSNVKLALYQRNSKQKTNFLYWPEFHTEKPRRIPSWILWIVLSVKIHAYYQ